MAAGGKTKKTKVPVLRFQGKKVPVLRSPVLRFQLVRGSG